MGLTLFGGTFWETPLDIWDTWHTIGSRCAFVTSYFAAPHMIRQRQSLIVIMPFTGQEMDDVFEAVASGCTELALRAERLDKIVGSGFVIRKITDMIERAEFIGWGITYLIFYFGTTLVKNTQVSSTINR